jgi:hypothetical protein
MDLEAPHDDVVTQKTKQTLRFYCMVPAKVATSGYATQHPP